MKPKINSRQKGKRVELDAVHLLHGFGFHDAARTAQVRGKDNGCADIECKSLGLHIEVKGDRSIGLDTKSLRDACEQAERDSLGKPWAVLWWEHRKGWRMTWWEDWRKAYVTVAGDEDIGNVMELYRNQEDRK